LLAPFDGRTFVLYFFPFRTENRAMRGFVTGDEIDLWPSWRAEDGKNKGFAPRSPIGMPTGSRLPWSASRECGASCRGVRCA
jgi:hypothetical protein